MPESTTFNTTAGQTIARKLLMAFLNTGTSSAPVWSIVGKRVEDSSQEYDWNKETTQDILGNTFTTMSAPTITQTFDPCNLDAGETALTKLWQLAIKDQDVAALAEQDMMRPLSPNCPRCRRRSGRAASWQTHPLGGKSF